MNKFFTELSRRNVFRVAAAYVVVAWIVLQVGSILFATFEAPGWVLKVFTTLIFLGFPIALIISWAFELTPDGIKKSESGSQGGKAAMTDLVLAGLLISVVGFYIISDLRTVAPGTIAPASEVIGDSIETGADGRVTVAVLPFANMSSDDEQQYFSDGITEEILNALAHIDGLKVTSRTSSFSFKSSPDDLPTVAAKLGVAHILEGSVRRSGDTLRITAQLIRAADDVHLWSQTFDRDLKDIFKVQEEISEAIAAALKVKLIGRTELAVEVDPQIYDLYLQALEDIDRASFADTERAIERLERVIEAEPDFPRAHSGLARAISWAVMTGARTGEDMLVRMEAAGHQALALDRNSREVFATLGTAAYFRGDLAWATANFAHAERLEALGMWDHFSYAGALIDQGRLEEAVRMAEATTDADPLNLSAYFGLGSAKAASGDAAGGLSAFLTAAEIAPENPISLYFGAQILAGHDGRMAEAIVMSERAYQIDPVDPEIQTQLALYHLSLGDYNKAMTWVEEALQNDPDIGFAAGVKGLILAASGKGEAARVLALRALDPNTGAKNFRFSGNNMLLHIAWPDAARGVWPQNVMRAYQRQWPDLFRFEEKGSLWSSSRAVVLSTPPLALPAYLSHLKAEGEDQLAGTLVNWFEANYGLSQSWTQAANQLVSAEIAMVAGQPEKALEIIEREVVDGYVLCWQWRLRDNPYFEPLRGDPRFKAALDGVARNIEMQKRKYEELKSEEVKS